MDALLRCRSRTPQALGRAVFGRRYHNLSTMPQSLQLCPSLHTIVIPSDGDKYSVVRVEDA